MVGKWVRWPGSKSINDRTTAGADKIWMVDNAAGQGQQSIQQPTINGSIGDMVTLVEAAAMVTVDARARAWQWRGWWQQRRQQ